MCQRKPESSRYGKPYAEGLFYVKGTSQYELDELVLSSTNTRIDHKANDPDAPTIPGFYRNGVRFDFLSVVIIRKRVFFPTRLKRGTSYAFAGVAGSSIEKEFSDTIRVPHIEGILKTKRNGKVISRRKVYFGHAVIA